MVTKMSTKLANGASAEENKARQRHQDADLAAVILWNSNPGAVKKAQRK